MLRQKISSTNCQSMCCSVHIHLAVNFLAIKPLQRDPIMVQDGRIGAFQRDTLPVTHLHQLKSAVAKNKNKQKITLWKLNCQPLFLRNSEARVSLQICHLQILLKTNKLKVKKGRKKQLQWSFVYKCITQCKNKHSESRNSKDTATHTESWLNLYSFKVSCFETSHFVTKFLRMFANRTA
ncbi:unnamed protein product [Ixodes pacificus]